MLSDERIQSLVDEITRELGFITTSEDDEQMALIIANHLEPTHTAVAERVVVSVRHRHGFWKWGGIEYATAESAKEARAIEVARVAAILAEAFPERGQG